MSTRKTTGVARLSDLVFNGKPLAIGDAVLPKLRRRWWVRRGIQTTKPGRVIAIDCTGAVVVQWHPGTDISVPRVWSKADLRRV